MTLFISSAFHNNNIMSSSADIFRDLSAFVTCDKLIIKKSEYTYTF